MVKDYRKAKWIKRLSKLFSRLLCHPILPGGVWASWIVALFTGTDIIGISGAALFTTALYIVGDEVDRRVSNWIGEISN